MAAESSTTWDELLPTIVVIYNNKVHSTTKRKPSDVFALRLGSVPTNLPSHLQQSELARGIIELEDVRKTIRIQQAKYVCVHHLFIVVAVICSY